MNIIEITFILYFLPRFYYPRFYYPAFYYPAFYCPTFYYPANSWATIGWDNTAVFMSSCFRGTRSTVDKKVASLFLVPSGCG